MNMQSKILLVFIMMVPTVSLAEENWDFKFTPYIWFAGVKGDVSTLPGSPIIPIDVSPSDAVKDSQVSLMMFFEAKKQRHGMLFDVLYSDSISNWPMMLKPSCRQKRV